MLSNNLILLLSTLTSLSIFGNVQAQSTIHGLDAFTGAGDPTSGALISSVASSASSPTSLSSSSSSLGSADLQVLIGTISGHLTTYTSNISSQSGSVITEATVVILTGTAKPATPPEANGTVSSSSTSVSTIKLPNPTNTTPCNGYKELCYRKYNNITQIAAHNSPFHVPNNVASNQNLGVIAQLDDGIRMLQAQVHLVNETLYLCHTSCDLLNAGTLTDYLFTVAQWVYSHPYDIITILLGNPAFLAASTFEYAIEASGILPFAYIPPTYPLGIDGWPFLAEMILNSSRVVFFLDYNEAGAPAVPYLLDEFQTFWETPMDPTDRSFPCTVQRPPGLTEEDVRSRMYIANHNLNTDLTILGNTLSVPTLIYLNVTNNVTGEGSLGVATEQCAKDWGKPPNFLSVDYYDVGNGSVFEVAAKWNNVTYAGGCCGQVKGGAIRGRGVGWPLGISVMAVVGIMIF
jgi:hypothetical protein